MTGLMESRKVVSKIDFVFPLARVKEAALRLEEGHATGKVIVTMV